MSDPTTRVVVAKFCTCGDALAEHADGGDGPCNAVHRFRDSFSTARGIVSLDRPDLPSEPCACQQFRLGAVVYAGEPGIRHSLDDCPCWRCVEDRAQLEAMFAERLRVSDAFAEAVRS